MSADLDAELIRMEGWIGGILSGLSPASRSRATRQIASMLRTGQSSRIAAQRNPDGGAFAARKKQKEQKASNATLKFLYPSGGSGAGRLVLLKSWVKRGDIYTGHDIERGEIRSFDKAKIIKHLPVTPEEQNKAGRKLRQRSTIKGRIMFHKLRTGRFLRSGSNANEAYVGFTGRAAELAGVHQRGGMDRPGPKAPPIRYDRRALLGLSSAEESEIMAVLVNMVADSQ